MSMSTLMSTPKRAVSPRLRPTVNPDGDVGDVGSSAPGESERKLEPEPELVSDSEPDPSGSESEPQPQMSPEDAAGGAPGSARVRLLLRAAGRAAGIEARPDLRTAGASSTRRGLARPDASRRSRSPSVHMSLPASCPLARRPAAAGLTPAALPRRPGDDGIGALWRLS